MIALSMRWRPLQALRVAAGRHARREARDHHEGQDQGQGDDQQQVNA
ncbi:MAG: hypothetical protein IPJ19_14885 [Planctomycetes bacterium]|nr:hypothetical protein [Planctomycetota bacterium]